MSKKKRSSKNLKIHTRIIISSVLAIVIPLIIIGSFSTVFINTVASYFKLSSVTTNSYSTINQLQWNQTVSSINDELMSDNTDEQKLENIVGFVQPLEQLDSLIYIECGEESFYSTKSGKYVLEKANELVPVSKEKNINYFGDNGLVIVNHAQKGDKRYLVVIVNENYSVNDSSNRTTVQEYKKILLGRTGIIVFTIVALFITAIVVLSIITTRTILAPIKKISKGAQEIARGNLDYKIDYKSTNELGQTVEVFNDMTEKLKTSIDKQRKAEEQRKELVAGIAHDLRTPLTSAKGYAEGIIDGVADTPEKQKKYLRTICSSISDTEKILDDLLAISRLELNGFELNRTDVNFKEFMDDGAREIGAVLEKEGFDFVSKNTCSDDTVVSLDTDQFERVITNIISNCIKYASGSVKGKVEMTVTEYEKTVIVEISDNGIGVDQSSLNKIFDIMYRTDPARTKVSDGSGLGLAVCRQIVELHSGSIWAGSREGCGLSVFISLPKKEVIR